MALHGSVSQASPSRATTASVRWFTLTALAESVGDSLSRTLLPIVAVSVLGAGAATVGVINSLGLLAFLLLGLPLGSLADRWSAPTAIMTTSTLVRAAAVLAAVGVWSLGRLKGTTGLAVLILLALVVGVADVAYTTGQGLLVPRLVETDRIRALFGRAQTASQIGGALGPMLLAGILAFAAAPLAWFSAATAYLASALTQRGIRPTRRAGAAPERTSMWAQARGGMSHVMGEPTLRKITVANTLNNAAVVAANTLLPVIALTTLQVSPATYAAIGVIGALAGIVGAASASTITSKLGLRTTRLAASAGMSIGIALVMIAGTVTSALPGPAELWLAIQSGLAGLCTSVALVAGADLAPRLSPREVLGSVMGAQRTLVLGVMPLSALAIGTLASVLGTVTATYVWLALTLASAIPCLTLTDPDRT